MTSLPKTAKSQSLSDQFEVFSMACQAEATPHLTQGLFHGTTAHDVKLYCI